MYAPKAPAAGLLALAFTAAAMLAGVLPVFALGLEHPGRAFDGHVLRVIRFTLLQAGLSTILSLAIGIPAALALARRNFLGRALLVRLLALPLAIPAIVGVLGIIAIFGTNGLLGGVFDLYGLTGILIAHVFFNFPMAARLALAALEAIPAENLRLAAQLGFTEADHWRHVDRPVLLTAMRGAALLIFLLCSASFTIVLTLGGGPQATTLEVAIYQALRFDFDPARATALAMAQIAICAVLLALSQRFPIAAASSPAVHAGTSRKAGPSPFALLFDVAFITLAIVLLLPPLLAILVSGIGKIEATPLLFGALAASIGIGLAASLLALTMAWPLAELAARTRLGRRAASAAAVAGLILPPAVMATGWFILLNFLGAANIPSPLLVVALNGLMALPFAYTVLAPAVARAAENHDRLCAGLGIAGLSRLRLIDGPALRRPIGLALVLAAIVSLGDLTAILMFGTGSMITLPALIYQQMGSYRMEGAAGTALVLAALAFLLLHLSERWSRHD